MKYMGSKARYAKEIIAAISKEVDIKNSTWVEPFCGGCNIIDKVKTKRRIGNDINYYIIKMFQAVQNGWKPPEEVSEECYLAIKMRKEFYAPELVAFVAIGCSYSGKWFGGYARGNTNKGIPRNYCLESRNNLLKQAENLKSVELYSGDYREFKIPTNSCIYNDIPYAKTTKYKDQFDHVSFWKWCDSMLEKGHKVFVSEYNAPDGWRCIWEKEVCSSLTKETGSKKAIERLFTK